jgi:hypothetical protein
MSATSGPPQLKAAGREKANSIAAKYLDKLSKKPENG